MPGVGQAKQTISTARRLVYRLHVSTVAHRSARLGFAKTRASYWETEWASAMLYEVSGRR
jgi:hypothetical protein